MFLGAKTDQLRTLASETEEIGGVVTEAQAFLISLLDLIPTIWVGDDARRFTTAVAQTHAPALQATAARLADASNELLLSANRQDATSDS